MSSSNPLARKERVRECFTQRSIITQRRASIRIRITVNLSDCGKDQDEIRTKINTAFLLHYGCLPHTWLCMDTFKHIIHLETRMQVKSYLKPELQEE